jgi:hypothetical protein
VRGSRNDEQVTLYCDPTAAGVRRGPSLRVDVNELMGAKKSLAPASMTPLGRPSLDLPWIRRCGNEHRRAPGFFGSMDVGQKGDAVAHRNGDVANRPRIQLQR